MISFDPKTLASWKERGISHITCTLTNTGCAGHKIQILEENSPSLPQVRINEGLNLSIRQEDLTILSESHITWTGKKWILKSEAINTRCGCGSSFSLKSGNPIHDKIERMKLIMKQKKEGIHS